VRGVRFDCGKTFLTGKKRELYYVVSNGITQVSWAEIHTPENIEVISKVKQLGKAEKASVEYALDSIPERRCRIRLLRMVWGLITPQSEIDILFENVRGVGPTYKDGVWRNNKPSEYYLSEIKDAFNITSVHDLKITAKGK
jgi:hypothetical protein